MGHGISDVPAPRRPTSDEGPRALEGAFGRAGTRSNIKNLALQLFGTAVSKSKTKPRFLMSITLFCCFRFGPLGAAGRPQNSQIRRFGIAQPAELQIDQPTWAPPPQILR